MLFAAGGTVFVSGGAVFIVGDAVFAMDGTVFAAEPSNRALPTRRPRYVFAAFG